MYFRVMNTVSGHSTDCRSEVSAIAAFKSIVDRGVHPERVRVFVVLGDVPGLETWEPFDPAMAGWADLHVPGVLPDSGAISLGAINNEFKRGNDVNAYRGTGWYKPNGQSGTFSSGTLGLDEFHGKQANSPETRIAITSNQAHLDLWSWAKTQGWDGISKLQVTVNGGVWVYSDDPARPALAIVNSYPGGVFVINNGYIAGRGGNGGTNGGGTALSIGAPVTFTNNGFIAGGGGGGAQYGGGGAGGGSGGSSPFGTGGGGGGPGQGGANGGAGSGGGGGRILPGAGGGGGYTNQLQAGGGGGGGGSGGGGGASNIKIGGHAGVAGSGGGGGWGAKGGDNNNTQAAIARDVWGGAGGSANQGGANGSTSGGQTTLTGGAGGKAIALNGNTITWAAQGTIYGAVS